MLKNKITAQSVKHGFVTEFTSMVVHESQQIIDQEVNPRPSVRPDPRPAPSRSNTRAKQNHSGNFSGRNYRLANRIVSGTTNRQARPPARPPMHRGLMARIPASSSYHYSTRHNVCPNRYKDCCGHCIRIRISCRCR